MKVKDVLANLKTHFPDYDGNGYHLNCNAETCFLVGDAMGKAMVELLGKD
jgi:hypothetical protein